MMKRNSGFTLIEILMSIMLMGILTAVSISAIESFADDAAFEKTYKRMLDIRTALIGDLDTNKQGLREYYGYLGDIGELPDALQGLNALLDRPGNVSSWAFDNTARIGSGWRGPYLKGTTGVNWLKDAWGRDFEYSATTSPPFIRSLGADNATGGTGSDADIQINFPTSITTATVHGVINRNSVVSDESATVVLHYPDGSGDMTTATTTVAADTNGEFTFSNIPFGLRALMVYVPDSSSPMYIIGPVLLSIDKEQYQVPHNFLDSAPGSMPHLCNDVDNYSFVAGSMRKSSAQNRIYFNLNIAQSMELTSFYVGIDNAASDFKRVRIGTDIKDCGAALDCMSRQPGNTMGDNTSYHELKYQPEIALASAWTIKAGDNVGGFVEFDEGVDDITFVSLRLGCRIITIE